jgi:hypothetical protein
MKRILLLLALALTMVACGQKDDKQGEQTEEKKVIVPPGMPVAPASQAFQNTELTLEPNSNLDPQQPVLKIEEGKPLDLSQLMGERKSFGEQVTAQIDTVRYFANEGKADYQYLYGASFENGWGVKEDAKQAMTWYRKAADQKQKAAYNAIGNLYRTGNGVNSDAKEALRWYRLGAEAGDAQAMLNVGNCYFYGMGTKKDAAQAVQWWQRAAEANNIYAQSQMGDCYLYGLGVEQDPGKAAEYYIKAADANVANAQYRLGLLYYYGQGVETDRTHAKLLLQKARDGGEKEAQDFLEKNFKE